MICPSCRFLNMLREMRRVAEDLTGERPNVDFALVALANAYHLPRRTPTTTVVANLDDSDCRRSSRD